MTAHCPFRAETLNDPRGHAVDARQPLKSRGSFFEARYPFAGLFIGLLEDAWPTGLRMGGPYLSDRLQAIGVVC